MRQGSGAEELQAPRTRFRSQRLHPRSPVFTGAQDRVVQHPVSGVEVSRHTLPLIPAAALLAVISSAPGPRDTPTADGPSRPSALPWAAEGATFVGISGSGKQRFVCPDLMRRSIDGRTEGPKSAFLWISKTVSFGAYKRNGFWKLHLKDTVLEGHQRRQPLAFASFLRGQKGARPQAKPDGATKPGRTS